MRIELAFGKTGLAAELPDTLRYQFLEARSAVALDDGIAALEAAMDAPIGTAPLVELAQGKKTAAISVCDITRPAPNRMVLPPLLARLEQGGITRENTAVLIATGPNWHGLMAMLAAKAGKDVYCEKPCTKNIAESLLLRDTMRRCGTVFQAGTQRRNLPHFAFACELARTGRLGRITRVYAHPAGMKAFSSGWLPEDPAPDPAVADWDMYLGPAAWRPFNANSLADGFNFEKGGGLVGGGVLEWGSHCVDLCQWAVGDCPPPVDVSHFEPSEMKISSAEISTPRA
jgi:hypothetical protein